MFWCRHKLFRNVLRCLKNREIPVFEIVSKSHKTTKSDNEIWHVNKPLFHNFASELGKKIVS